jgi:uncharacterized protein YndB with AHSA1/START domain
MDVQVSIKDRVLRPVSDVFEAIVDPDRLSGFFVSAASGPLTEGAMVTWHFVDVGATVSATVKRVKQNELISFEWAASGVTAKVDIMLEAINPTTTSVKIVEDGWPLDKQGVARALGQTQGWTDFLCCMKAFLYTGINLRQGRTKDIR